MSDNKITQAQVDAEMKDVVAYSVMEPGHWVTYVSVRMRNGFVLRESIQPVDENNYDAEVGKKICLKRIAEQVRFLLGYMQCEDDLRRSILSHGLMNTNPFAGRKLE